LCDSKELPRAPIHASFAYHEQRVFFASAGAGAAISPFFSPVGVICGRHAQSGVQKHVSLVGWTALGNRCSAFGFGLCYLSSAIRNLTSGQG